jgi:hypothetical protein
MLVRFKSIDTSLFNFVPASGVSLYAMAEN